MQRQGSDDRDSADPPNEVVLLRQLLLAAIRGGDPGTYTVVYNNLKVTEQPALSSKEANLVLTDSAANL